jgi:hypothetical protein
MAPKKAKAAASKVASKKTTAAGSPRAVVPAAAAAAAVAWERDVAALIEGGDADAVAAVEQTLRRLTAQAQTRLIAAKRVVGVGVVLVDGNQTQGGDVGNNISSRCVTAHFTAGPRAAPFSISFENEDEEGDESVVVACELFTFEDDAFAAADGDTQRHFLTTAGLLDALPSTGEDETGPLGRADRQRAVVADVLHDAVALVVAKYGEEDTCGVSLMGAGNTVRGWFDADFCADDDDDGDE